MEQVVAARKVGLGFVHETGVAGNHFRPDRYGRWKRASHRPQVMEVDNARETVRKEKSAASLARNAAGRITDGLGHLPSFNPYSAPS